MGMGQQLRYRGVSLIRDPLVSVMATYRGHVRTRQDAILLFEACQLDVLPKILRRLSRKERKNVISPGAVFVWDEVEAGIQRWTDGRLWGSITLSEEFIVRREMERKARKLSIVQESTAMDVDGEASRRGSDGDVQMEEGTTDDYHYKKNGLIRRSMTITSNGRQLHLVTYDDPTCGFTPELPSPTSDSLLKHLIEEKIASRSASHLDLQRPQIQACEPSRWPSYVSRAGLWNTFRWHHTISPANTGSECPECSLGCSPSSNTSVERYGNESLQVACINLSKPDKYTASCATRFITPADFCCLRSKRIHGPRSKCSCGTSCSILPNGSIAPIATEVAKDQSYCFSNIICRCSADKDQYPTEQLISLQPTEQCHRDIVFSQYACCN